MFRWPRLCEGVFLTLMILLTLPASARLKLETVASGVDMPSFITSPPNDPSRLVVPQLDGLLRIIVDGVLQEAPFLDLRDFVLTGQEDWGYYGFAFHPNFANNGHFFVSYITDDNGTLKNEVYRYRVLGSTSGFTQADPATRTQILSIPQVWPFHHGGHLAFSPNDGYLYYMMSDNDDHYGPMNQAQDLTSIFGKMLRIDVNGTLPYTVPPTNPFVSVSNAVPEIWSLGHRNPWRFSFDRLTGDLWTADVGQWSLEEVNFQPGSSAGGENYGWNVWEANRCVIETQLQATCDALLPQVTLPVHVYPRNKGISVTGGYVFRGPGLPQLQGKYIFADFGSARVWALTPGTYAERELTSQLDPDDDLLRMLVSFGEDAHGNLYLVSLEGPIWKFVLEHDGDYTGDGQINISELLRLIQLYNSNGYHCDTSSEDGFAPGPGDLNCDPHTLDYKPQNWRLNLGELLRAIQIFNSAGYTYCPTDPNSEDGFCIVQ